MIIRKVFAGPGPVHTKLERRILLNYISFVQEELLVSREGITSSCFRPRGMKTFILHFGLRSNVAKTESATSSGFSQWRQSITGLPSMSCGGFFTTRIFYQSVIFYKRQEFIWECPMTCAVQEISLSYYSGHFQSYDLYLYLLHQLFQMFNICNFTVFFHRIKPFVSVAHAMFPKSKQHRNNFCLWD